jgi:hypothetical protein
MERRVSPGCRLLRHQPDGGTVPKGPPRQTDQGDRQSVLHHRSLREQRHRCSAPKHGNRTRRCLLGRQKNKSSVGWVQSVRWIQSSVRLATVSGASSGMKRSALSTKANSTRSAKSCGVCAEAAYEWFVEPGIEPAEGEECRDGQLHPFVHASAQPHRLGEHHAAVERAHRLVDVGTLHGLRGVLLGEHAPGASFPGDARSGAACPEGGDEFGAERDE